MCQTSQCCHTLHISVSGSSLADGLTRVVIVQRMLFFSGPVPPPCFLYSSSTFHLCSTSEKLILRRRYPMAVGSESLGCFGWASLPLDPTFTLSRPLEQNYNNTQHIILIKHTGIRKLRKVWLCSTMKTLALILNFNVTEKH